MYNLCILSTACNVLNKWNKHNDICHKVSLTTIFIMTFSKILNIIAITAVLTLWIFNSKCIAYIYYISCCKIIWKVHQSKITHETSTHPKNFHSISIVIWVGKNTDKYM